MVRLTLETLRVFCIPLVPEVFEYLNCNQRATFRELTAHYPDEAALQKALDALVDKGWVLRMGAHPEVPVHRYFLTYLLTAPGMEMGRLLGLEQPGLGRLVAGCINRIKSAINRAT